MKLGFKKGDRVSFLNESGVGLIMTIKNERMAEVELETGLVISCLISELVAYRSMDDYQLSGMSMYDEYDAKVNRLQPTQKKAKNNVSVFNTDERVVDLHIEELVDNHLQMSNGQILNIQMAHFQRELNVAIRSKIRKFIVIHGVGEGVLRNTIRKELNEHYPQYDFHDASYREFGYGATEIILR
jgi:myo-inositol-1-phosphate synthase